MSDQVADTPAAAPAAKSPAKKKNKGSKQKKPANHPKYSEMIKAAISSLKERGGSSRQAILKYILASYNVGKDDKVVNSHLKMALRAGAKNENLKQSKGTGASGSFKLGVKDPAKPNKDKSPQKATTPKAAKAKPARATKPKAKKSAASKKPAVAKKVKSPKKAKKPTVQKAATPKTKSPKKKASPKKAAKKPAKK